MRIQDQNLVARGLKEGASGGYKGQDGNMAYMVGWGTVAEGGDGGGGKYLVMSESGNRPK